MIGESISNYKILEKLGEGGMGIVYKAQDTKLDRLVALKFLPSHLSASGQEKARFIQEAKAASALNYPNVCTIHDIQDHNGQLFIVMEFVDGQTLREKKTSVSFKQGLEIGIQIADGLAAAHEKGIVHRDIKPENIMIRKDGIAMIMDFGLAKFRTGRSAINRLTQEGSTVGTAGYMSPEQVQGHDVDHRSDIFSLGVLLYELFTGELPFRGVHETALLYEIVNVDPVPMSSVKPEIDASLDAIVLECLAKDPGDRYQSAAEIAKDLRRYKRESTKQRVTRTRVIQPVSRVDMPVEPELQAAAGEGSEHSPLRQKLWMWVSLVSIAAIGVLVAVILKRSGEAARSLHAELLPPPNTSYSVANGGGQFALSPDGNAFAFAAVDTGGKTLLWVRSLQSSSARVISGTEEAEYPFWSPDGKNIAFFARGKLLRVDAAGGVPFTICDAISPRGGTWNKDGIIIFAPDQSKGLFRVRAVGGKADPLTHLDTTLNELTHRWPAFLPDEDHYLFFARGSLAGFGGPDKDHIYVGSLSKGSAQRLFSASSDAVYAEGMILYFRENSIVGQWFDPGNQKVSGNPMTIAQDVQYTPRWSKGSFSVSQNGTIAFQPGGQESRPDIVLVNKEGSVLKRLGRLDLMFRAAISPDGRRLAMDILDGQSRNIDVWIYDIERGIKTRLTFSKSADLSPIWSPDGKEVAYSTGMGLETRIVTQPVTGSGEEDVIAQLSADAFVSDWSSDNKYLLYFTRGNADIWVIPLSGKRTPAMILGSEYNEVWGKFSPDVRWIAYQSDESGKGEIYVRSFVPPGSPVNSSTNVKRQISVDGGSYPIWRNDGKGIFYTTPHGIMLAELRIEGSSLEVVSVKPFSSQRMAYFGDILPTGGIIVSQSAQVASGVVPINIIVNWNSDLAKNPE